MSTRRRVGDGPRVVRNRYLNDCVQPGEADESGDNDARVPGGGGDPGGLVGPGVGPVGGFVGVALGESDPQAATTTGSRQVASRRDQLFAITRTGIMPGK
jgi:hypothetical protein